MSALRGYDETFIKPEESIACDQCEDLRGYIRRREKSGRWGETRIKMESRIKDLEAWVRDQGEQYDTCTYQILGEICKGCNCKRKPKGDAA